MKKSFLFLVSVAIVLTGCAGPRTGSLGYKNEVPILTTNMVGTVTSQKVGDQPVVTYAQTNFSIISTPPVEKRTWRERVFGQRSPGATSQSAFPPFPNAGITGVSPVSVGGGATSQAAPQQPQAQRGTSSGVPRGRTPSGAPLLLPSRPSQGGYPQLQPSRPSPGSFPRLQPNRVTSSGSSGTIPGIYGRNDGRVAVLTFDEYVSGRQVSPPTTRFARSALAHDAQIHGGVPRNARLARGVRGNSYHFTAGVTGAGQFRSGMRR